MISNQPVAPFLQHLQMRCSPVLTAAGCSPATFAISAAEAAGTANILVRFTAPQALRCSCRQQVRQDGQERAARSLRTGTQSRNGFPKTKIPANPIPCRNQAALPQMALEKCGCLTEGWKFRILLSARISTHGVKLQRKPSAGRVSPKRTMLAQHTSALQLPGLVLIQGAQQCLQKIHHYLRMKNQPYYTVERVLQTAFSLAERML